MATKDQNSKSPVQKGGQPGKNKTGKGSGNIPVTKSNTSDLQQRDSSNKGKGPAGENL